ncbi:amidohydrolase [Actinomadura sp. NBRC 104412]|uniref:amidohydrolase family protein n=1 Tax=Actinomadura sp. NBRC 104412 TaxID=3032203 RepID=UPI0024A44FB6|nr:amidohydrolase family protein [Actinomadura sp. NBRC 104412]GLZ08148.1 amidohydrolase [Actinomadura sp. NBRC 104412]
MIDVHTHMLPEAVPDAPSDAAERAGWPVVEREGERRRVMQAGTVVRVLTPPAWDVSARLAEMDAVGVDVQVLMPIPFTFLYDTDAKITGALARAQNDALAAIRAAHPGRFAALGTVPLQNPALAVAELRRIVGELGLAGVEIGTHVRDVPLHDPRFEPFFAAAEELSAAVFIHPGRTLEPTRTAHNGLAFGLARPVETALAAGSLVHGGVLTRHPGLRICLAHGGGCTPMLAGRWQQGWELLPRPEALADIAPRDLLARLWVDTLTYDPDALALAARVFGTGRLVLGSDYPFTVAERPLGAAVAKAVASDSLPGLGPGWADDLADNARRFLAGTPTLTKAGHP